MYCSAGGVIFSWESGLCFFSFLPSFCTLALPGHWFQIPVVFLPVPTLSTTRKHSVNCMFSKSQPYRETQGIMMTMPHFLGWDLFVVLFCLQWGFVFAGSGYTHSFFLPVVNIIIVFRLLLWLHRKADESGKVRKNLTKKLFLEGEIHRQKRQ